MLTSKLVAPLVATSLLLAASVATAEEPAAAAKRSADDDLLLSDAPKPRYPPSSVRLKLAIGGLAVTGIAYAAAYGVTSNWPEVPGAEYLKAPVVGPWIALGKSGCSSDDPNCGAGKIVLRGILYVIDGIAQIGGLGLVGEAIFMKTEPDAVVRKSSARAFVAPSGPTLRPFPLITPSVTGLGILGTF
jgi:hypothetical protein